MFLVLIKEIPFPAYVVKMRSVGRSVTSPEHGLCSTKKRCFILPVLAAIFLAVWHSESITR